MAGKILDPPTCSLGHHRRDPVDRLPRAIRPGGERHGVRHACSVKRMVVALDVKFELQPARTGPGKVLAPQVIVILEGIPPAQDCEVVGRLKDARDRHTGLGGVVHRGCCATTSEALRLQIAARVENV